MPRVWKWLRSNLVWVGVAGVGVVFLIVGAYFGLSSVQAAPSQPIEFNHSLHTSLGIQCLYCHAGATRADSAGLPTLTKCMGCHNQIEVDSPGKEALAEYAASKTRIPWVPVAIQPDFVRFSHAPHVKAGLDCEECHGNVSSMTVAEPQPGQNMGWCLKCHQEQAPDRYSELSDCSTCHY